MRLRLKLLVPFLALPLGSILVLGLLAYANGRSMLETSLGRLFEMGATRGLNSLDREALGLYRGAEAWTTLDRMQDVITDDLDGRISSFLVARAREQPYLRRAVVADPAGRVIAASHSHWLGSVLGPVGAAKPEGGQACRDDSLGAAATLVCSFPIRAHFDEAQVLGTLEVAWDLGSAFDRLRRAEPGGPIRPQVVLLRRDGLVVSAPPDRARWLGARLDGSRAAALALAGGQGYLVEPIAGESLLVGYAHSAGPSGWSMLVIETAGLAFAPVGRLRGAVLGVGGAVAAAAVVLSLLLSGALTRAVRELEAAARRVADGDLSVRLLPRSGDEIGSLARSFDQMVRELARQRGQLVDKEYVDSMIAGMSDGLFVVDAAGRVDRANPALLARSGFALGDIVGRPAGLLFQEGETVFAQRVLEPARRTGAATEVELGLRTAAAGPVPVIVSAGLLQAGSGGVVCICTDITQRKQAESELQRARESAEAAAAAKAQFLAVVSHEVRTPLNGVIGMTDLLAGTSLSDKQREYVQTARRSGESLLALLEDILDFSRMDAGRFELARVAFDLRDCVFGAVDLLMPAALGKDLELSVRLDEALPQRVVGDPQRLRQVLLNLGGNAVKFTDVGSVVVAARSTPGEPSVVSFSISDTGSGIGADDQARIFEPFQQVDGSATRRHGGVGLGLAIARELVARMKGTIRVESEEGRGSTFAFSVELPPVADDRPRPLADPSALAGLRVLVIDDNATNRLVLREMLATWHCVVGEAADAWEALDRLRAAVGSENPFELALVDFQMPEMDGAALAREIASDARLAGLPLVLLTSIPQHAGVADAFEGRFAARLAKPIRQAVLLETLLEVNQRRRRPPQASVTAFRPR